MIGNSKIHILIICQSGELEIKACLLAASLRDVFFKKVEIHFAIHQNEKNKLSRYCENLIDTLDVQRFYFTSNFYRSYPIGNKISAIAQFPTNRRRVFMDSDMFVFKPFDLKSVFLKDLALKPADRLWAIRSEEQWKELYSKFDLKTPNQLIETTVSQEKTLPYYNAGLVVMNKGIQLGKDWEVFAQHLLSHPPHLVNHENTWIDQLALPLVITKNNISVKLLSEQFNYPAHIKLIDNTAAIIHYHNPQVIRREPKLNLALMELVKTYTALGDLLNTSNIWSALIQAYKTPHKKKKLPFFYNKKLHSIESRISSTKNNFIISGIPRSGTSLITRLLDDQKQIVAINEPHEIHDYFRAQKIPVEIPVFMETLKTQILDGIPIHNKVKKGRVVTDTKRIDRRIKQIYTLDGPDFFIGIKNTLSFLLRLGDLTTLFSKEQLVVCFRSPVDTISSWQKSFPHLRNVDINSFPVGGLNDRFISSSYKKQLLLIDQEKSAFKKRVLFWAYLAQIILDNIQKISILHYESLIQGKSQYLNSLELFKPYAFSSASDNIIVSAQKKLTFNDEEKYQIESTCGPIYSELLSYLNSNVS
jgi:hypothetical protein